MFTWIITHQTIIRDVQWWLFTLEKSPDLQLHLGQSIAHDGACMTITEVNHETYSFFAMEESFRKTNFAQKVIGETFNIELCVQASSMLDGHIVSGHIDTTWTVTETKLAEDGSKKLTISVDPQWNANLIPKGSITINGVSLTVVEIWSGRYTVWLIPLTQEITNLWEIKIGDLVNLEFDMIGKYIINYLNHQNNSVYLT